MPEDKVDVTVKTTVTGKEGMNIGIDYTNTDLKTVLTVELAQISGFLKVALFQARALGVDEALIAKLLDGIN